ncbi:hypothetical protein KFL_013370010 [Klebsormidium nitens]|uniref:Ubiquinone biosynthesis protein COQ4 homolog, mitochondrial n=1 Tax=Klebsormidium nitens TaxID=105231 RepID=A0A1Y1IXY9_KLENI|nr:hypothetical protein KFL_013370010 [Klebsormidium nitens]|eukprot:GAQ93168.1 hypothetical protein KFL_013370010 [Klebsormidium nitens]
MVGSLSRAGKAPLWLTKDVLKTSEIARLINGTPRSADAQSFLVASCSGRTFAEAHEDPWDPRHLRRVHSSASSQARPDFSDAHGPEESAEPGARPAAGLGQGRDGLSYATHMPLTPLQTAAVAVGSAFGALRHPDRADLVAALGETTGLLAFRRMRERMQRDPEGRSILADRPRITAASVAHAWDLPPGTFGAAYAQFMGSRNFSADERPPVRFVDDPELAYVAVRSREVHDFWHVLFDCPTTVTGELALKMVEFVQTGMPMCALSVLGGPFRLPPQKRQLLLTHCAPWALKAGTRAADLMCLRYENHLEEDLEQLRRRWKILPSNPAPSRKKP